VALEVVKTDESKTAQALDPKAMAKELRKCHVSYSARATEWEFFNNSYEGGRRYYNGGYLYKHRNEEEDDFKHRQEVACYYNFCQEIVDLYVSYLFQNEAKIEYGSLGKDTLFQSFEEDCDLKGNRLKSFLRESQRKASSYGHVAIVVDKPKPLSEEEVETLQDEQDKNIRPYVYRLDPTEITDWKYERIGTQGYQLTMLKIKEEEDPETYRLWYQDRWELWEIKKDMAELLDEGPNPLGEIPVVFLLNLATDEDLTGRSDLNDIAYVNRHIFNLCSWNDENIENTCFAMLARAKRVAGEGGSAKDDDVGPSIIVEYDPEAPNDKPYWLEPPGVSQDVFDKRLDRDVSEIHRMAKMGGVAATPEEMANVAKSGIALELEFRQMNSALAEKADNIEEAHEAIVRFYAKWQSTEASGTIDYPDDFNVEDLAQDLENAIEATALRISPLFNVEMKKRLVRVALPKLPADRAKEIEDEIDRSEFAFIPAEYNLLLSNNLANAIEIVMALRGVDEAEAKKILDENKAINAEYSISIMPAAPTIGAPGGDEDET
jgi:hypothetical protein